MTMTAMQHLLRDSARDVLGDTGGRQAGDRPDESTLWTRMRGLDWPAAGLPPDQGGIGGGFGMTAVLLEEAGRHLVGTPLLISTAVIGHALAITYQSSEQAGLLRALAEGTITASAGLCGSAGLFTGEGLGLDTWQQDDQTYARGTAHYLLEADAADYLVLAGRDAGGQVAVVGVEAARVQCSPWPTGDLSRHLFTATLAGAVPVVRLGGELLYETLVQLGGLSIAWDSLGGAEAVLAMTVAYARTRRQFDRAIGSFQAVKHRCANMHIAVQGARAAVEWATELLDGGDGLVEPACIAARVQASEAYAAVAALALDSHGGIGYTWEYPLQRFAKRAELNYHLFGDPRALRTRLATRWLASDADHASAQQQEQQQEGYP